MDLCVYYKECQEFTPPGTSAVQVYYGNVYLSTVIVFLYPSHFTRKLLLSCC